MAPHREIRVMRVLRAGALPIIVATLIATLGVVAWGRGDLNTFICDGDCGPDYVMAPAGLTTATDPGEISLPAASLTAGPVNPTKLAAAVDEALDAEALGSRVGFAAISPDDGTALVSAGPGTYTPASTTKVLTAFAALSTIDPHTRFTTRVVRSTQGIVLVGGGDPYLVTKPATTSTEQVFRADLTTLASETATALKSSGLTKVELAYDDSLFPGPDVSPGWEPSYVPDQVVTPVSALWVDQGITDGVRSGKPARSAARTFAALLSGQGITVTNDPGSTTAGAAAITIAQVRSARVDQIVEMIMRVSDNEAAEVMLRHSAIAAGHPASFAGGARAVREALEAAGVAVAGLRLDDGSGLARSNLISPQTLVETLRAASASPRTSGLLADLPVSGFTGTLTERFAGLGSALGLVRAKTGTLSGVHSLAGYAVDSEGRPVLFAVMADRVDFQESLAAQSALDRVAAAIADCRCG